MSWKERGVDPFEKVTPQTAQEYAQNAVISVAVIALLAILAHVYG